MIMMPLGNILMPKWGVSSSVYYSVVSSYSIAAGISALCGIFIADNYDRKKFLLVVYIGFLLGTLACAFANDTTTMLFSRIVAGLFGGLISAQVLSIIGDVIPYERRGKAMGLLMGGFGLASVLGVPLGLKLANEYGWESPFYFICIMGAIIYPLLLTQVPKINGHLTTKVPLKNRIQNIKQIVGDPKQMAALKLTTFMVMGHFIIIPLINPYMVRNAGVAESQAPLIYFIGGIFSMFVAQFAGRLADKFGKLVTYKYFALSSLPFIIIITNMPAIHIALILSVFAVWFSTATGRTVPGQAMITQSVKDETRGSFMSLNSFVQSIATGFITWIGGQITYSDAQHKIYNYPILGIISVVLVLISVYFAEQLNKKILQ
jgi:predicted MFS family arabinose efflux permease